jgi:hypothetical protein
MHYVAHGRRLGARATLCLGGAPSRPQAKCRLDGSARTPRQLRRYGVHPRYRDGRPLSTHPPSGRENLEAPGRHLTLEAMAA